MHDAASATNGGKFLGAVRVGCGVLPAYDVMEHFALLAGTCIPTSTGVELSTLVGTEVGKTRHKCPNPYRANFCCTLEILNRCTLSNKNFRKIKHCSCFPARDQPKTQSEHCNEDLRLALSECLF